MRLGLLDPPTCVGLRYGHQRFSAERLFLSPTPVTSGLSARLAAPLQNRLSLVPSPLCGLRTSLHLEAHLPGGLPLRSTLAVQDSSPVVHRLPLPGSA